MISLRVGGIPVGQHDLRLREVIGVLVILLEELVFQVCAELLVSGPVGCLDERDRKQLVEDFLLCFLHSFLRRAHRGVSGVL